MPIYEGNLVSLPKSELRLPRTVSRVARFWNIPDHSGDRLADLVMEELTCHHNGSLYDWRRRVDFRRSALDLVALKTVDLFGRKELKRMKALEKFRDRETIEVFDLFGDDEGRTLNRLREFSNRHPRQALSRALIPRMMFLDFAMRIRAGRLGLEMERVA